MTLSFYFSFHDVWIWGSENLDFFPATSSAVDGGGTGTRTLVEGPKHSKLLAGSFLVHQAVCSQTGSH